MESDDHNIIDTENEESDSSINSFSTTIASLINPPTNHPIDSTPLATGIMASSDMKIAGFNPFTNLTVLKKGNFHEWKAKVVTALSAARLGPFILSDQSPPADPSKLDEYTVRNFQALSIIQSSVDSEHFQLFANLQSAREAYLAILSQYDDSGGLSTVMIFSELLSLRLDDGGNLSDHVTKFRTLHNKLSSNMKGTPDLNISEAFIAIMLLKSLPQAYLAIVQTTLANFESIKLSRIYTILTMESTRSSNNPSLSDTALAASDIPNKTKPKTTNKKVTCSLGHYGHSDEQCITRRYKELEKEVTDLKKERDGKSKPEQAKAASSTIDTTTSYWDAAFTCHKSIMEDSEIADTGASTHMYQDVSKLSDIKNTPPVSISIASKDGSVVASKQGNVTVGFVTLTKVLQSDQLSSNLISIGRLCDEGHVAVFRRTEGAILDTNGLPVIKFIRDPHSDKLWHPVRRSESQTAQLTRTDKCLTADLWHRRLGHLHPDGVISLLKTIGKPPPSRDDFIGCEECMAGKSTQSPCTSSFHRSPNALDLVHSNLLGPIHPPTRNGKRYVLSFIDDHTRYNHIYLLASKDETIRCFSQYKSLVERQTGRKIGKLKSDRGGKYSSTEFLSMLQRDGIEIERGPAHRPQANSVSERFFQTLLGRMRTQMNQSGLPAFLWGELANYCSLQINCAPSKSINMKIPIFEYQASMVGHFHPFDFTRLRPFGCLAFAHTQNRQTKLEATARRMIFVGLERGARADRLWDKSSGKILVSGDVKHREEIFPATIHPGRQDTSSTPDTVLLQLPTLYDEDCRPPDPNQNNTHDHPITLPDTEGTNPDAQDDFDIEPQECPINTSEDEPRRSTRPRITPSRYGFTATDISSQEHDHPTYNQALQGPEAAAWRRACREEFELLLQHNVGSLVEAPAGANVLGGM